MAFAKISAIVLLVAVAGLFFPQRQLVAPEWHIKVIDEAGKPWPGIRLTESWQQYSLERHDHEDSRTTNSEGVASFPLRTKYSGVGRRFVGCAWQVVRSIVHSTCGPWASLMIDYPPGYGQNFENMDVSETSQAYITYEGSGPQQVSKTVVIHKCRNGGTGSTCYASQPAANH